MIETWLLAFIPLFVAIDILGVLPLFLSLTGGLAKVSSLLLAAIAIMMIRVGISETIKMWGK